MFGRKKESYVSHVESGSRSISSGVPIKEFVTRCYASKFALAQRMQALPHKERFRNGSAEVLLTAVVVDVVSSEDAGESSLQNAIERLRDPSHVRMLPPSELDACMAMAGFQDIERTTWDKSREFEEWMEIVNDPARAEPIRIVIRALAEAGSSAGMGLSIQNDQIAFFHRWRLLRATKPL